MTNAYSSKAVHTVAKKNGYKTKPLPCKLKYIPSSIKRILFSFGVTTAGMFFVGTAVHAQDVWKGTVSGAWEGAGNWQSGTLPGASTDVIIDTNGAPNTPKITTNDAQANNAVLGLGIGSVGVLDIDGVGAILNQVGILYIGGQGTGTMNIINSGMLATGGVAYIGQEAGAEGNVLMDGASARWSIGANSYVGEKGKGTVTLTNGAELITGAFVNIGHQVGSDGKVLINNNAVMTSVGELSVGVNGKGTLTVSSGGLVNNSSIVIAQNATSQGFVNLGAASTDFAASVGSLNVPNVSFGSGDGHLVFNHTDVTGNYIFFPTVGGTRGDVHFYSGVTTFDKSNSYGGQTTVHGGTFQVANISGSATGSSAVIVNVSGMLVGSGMISGSVDVSGGIGPGGLYGPGVLTVGNLTLNAGANLYYRLNEGDNDVSTKNDRIHATGHLTVNGSPTVNGSVNSAGAYLLIKYDGTYNNGLFGAPVLSTQVEGFTPTGTIRYDAGSKAIYLDVTGGAGPGGYSYWNGATVAGGSGSVLGDGGTGTWDSATTNWTVLGGATSGVWDVATGLAVFAGTSGIVTVSGAQNFNTIQMVQDGYIFNGDGLFLEQVSAGATSATVNVGSNKTVTFNTVFQDGATANKLNIVGGGTARLYGVNTFTGGVNVVSSTIETQAETGFGTGNISLTDSTLVYGAAFDIGNSRTIDLTETNTFNTNGFNSRIDAVIGGTTGALTKTGAGILTLSGANTYTGTTRVKQGTLAIDSGGSISNSSAVVVAGGATFDMTTSAASQSIRSLSGAGTVNLGSNNLMLLDAENLFSGVISGSGAFQVVNGFEILSGVNTYTGETRIATGSGALVLIGNGSIAGSSGINMPFGGTFDISNAASDVPIQSLNGSGAVSLGSKTLILTNASGVYSGVISGTGGLTVAAGTERLRFPNSYSGVTQINNGATLVLAALGQVKNSRKVVANGVFDISNTARGALIRTLAGSATGNVYLGPQTLTITDAADTFSGTISGTGGLTVVGGTQLLAGPNTYSGQTTIGVNLTNRTFGTLGAAGVNVLSAASPFVVKRGASLDLRGYGQMVMSLDNAGIVTTGSKTIRSLRALNPTILTVTGAYTSNGGQLMLLTDLMTGVSDKLTVDSVVLGSAATGIRVSNAVLGGNPTSGSGILLVQTQSVANAMAFELAGPVSAGAYDYKLYYGPAQSSLSDPQGWYLRSSVTVDPGGPGPVAPVFPDYRPEVPLYTSNLALANRAGLAMLGTYHDRYAQVQANDSSGRFWGRFFGQTGDVSYAGGNAVERFNSFKNHGASYSYNLVGFQVGVDKTVLSHANGARSVVGGYFGAGHTSADVDQVLWAKKAGENKFNSYALGAYWTYMTERNAYAEAVLQLMAHDNMHSRSERGLGLDTHGFGAALSLEGGYPFELGSNWWIEPQAQLVLQHTAIKDQEDGFGRIDFDNAFGAYGRVGARISTDQTVKRGGKVSFAGRVNLWHGFRKNASATVSNLSGSNPVDFNSSLGGSWVQLGVSVNAKVTDRVNLFFGADYNRGIGSGKGDGYGLRLGVRYAW